MIIILQEPQFISYSVPLIPFVLSIVLYFFATKLLSEERAENQPELMMTE